MTFKEKVYYQFIQLSDERLQLLQRILRELTESAKNETKSTAGDKHETALAILQTEQENIRKQLIQNGLIRDSLQRIFLEKQASTVNTGSLIKTNRGIFLLGVAAGKCMVEQKTILSLSIQSPLGNKLIGSKTGDIVTIHSNQYIIEKIYP